MGIEALKKVRFRWVVMMNWLLSCVLGGMLALSLGGWDSPGSPARRVASLAAVAALAVVAIRVIRVAAWLENEHLIVRNPLRSYRIPIAEVSQIGSRHTVLLLTMATPWGQLTIRRCNAGRIVVSASTGVGPEGLQGLTRGLSQVPGLESEIDLVQLALPKRERSRRQRSV